MKVLLIGGCDRSGTTLLGAMLGASPGVVCTPESQFKTEILENGEADRRLVCVQLALDAITRHWRFSTWGLKREDIVNLSVERHASYARLLERLVSRYAESLGQEGLNTGAPQLWLDHTPSNIRHLHRLFSMFPDAVCIHMVRDGRAVAASVMPLDWGPNTVFFAARWWARQLAQGLAAEQYFGPEKVRRIRYEDLVAAPEAEMKAICRFVGIEYVPAMRTASGFRLPSYTADQHRRLRAGRIDPERANGWRNTLRSNQIELFEYITGDLLTYLGYRLDNPWPSAPAPAAIVAAWVEEAFRWTTNRVRRWVRKRRLLRG